ncbi:Alfin [Sesbania bispinosa]|nr:Alfin [Sesbania bispinosa]
MMTMECVVHCAFLPLLGVNLLSMWCEIMQIFVSMDFPAELWELITPLKNFLLLFPEPALGINLARDGMQKKDWLSLVAVHRMHGYSLAFFFGTRFGFDKADRTRLFTMINDLPTVFEVVTGTAKKQEKEKSSVSNHNNNKSKSSANGRGSESGEYSKANKGWTMRDWMKMRSMGIPRVVPWQVCEDHSCPGALHLKEYKCPP